MNPDPDPKPQYNAWTLIGPLENIVRTWNRKQRVVLCRCVCGKERRVAVMSLITGKSKSCGCIRPKVCTGKVKDGVDEIALGLSVARMHLKQGEIPSHEFLAAFCGCSRQRIRQIEADAIVKLRRLLQREGISELDLIAA